MVSTPRALMLAASRPEAGRVRSPRHSCSGSWPPRARSADGLEIRADSIVLRKRRRSDLGDEEAATALVELDLAAGGRGLAFPLGQLVPRRSADEQQVLALG